MSAMTDYTEKKLLDHLLGKAAYTMPATVYLALFTASPTDTGSTAAEVSAGGYSRQAITSAMSATGATSGQSTNSSTVTFGPASADWGVITHAAIMDASTAGNMLMYAALDSSRDIKNGDSLQFSASQLVCTFG